MVFQRGELEVKTEVFYLMLYYVPVYQAELK